MKNKYIWITLLLPFEIYASAAYIGVHSVDGMGRSNAGEAAIAETASAITKNPALILSLEGEHLSIGANLVFSKFEAQTLVNPFVQEGEEWNGGNTGSFGPNKLPIPGVHYSNNKGHWGYGVSSSSFYGGLFSFDNDDWGPRAMNDDTALLSNNIQFDLAYRINPRLDVGFGLDVSLGYAEINRRSGDIAGPILLNNPNSPVPVREAIEILNSLQNPSEKDVFGGVIAQFLDDINVPDFSIALDPKKDLYEFRGTSYAFGWHAGLAYQATEKLNLGLSYRSSISHTFEGEYKSNLPVLPQVWGPLGTAGEDKAGQVALIQPALVEMGLLYQINSQWAIHGGFSWQEWSKMQSLTVETGDGEAIFTKDLPSKDQFRYAIGATYKHNDKWTWRSGIALDQTASKKSGESLVFPSSDRWWYSMGFNYVLSDSSSLDFSISYAENEKIEIEEKSLVVDVFFDDFPEANTINEFLDVLEIEQLPGVIGNIPIDLGAFVRDTFYDSKTSGGENYKFDFEGQLLFLGLQWNKKF